MVRKDTELNERTEEISHRDAETPRDLDLCVFVSPWLIFSVSSRPSESEAGS
jgi:hypothetical protein